MTDPSITTRQPIRFQGAPASALDMVLQKSTGGQKLLGKALQLKEGDNGLSYLTFLQDTLVALIPRAIVSRSNAELTESTFLELMESAVLYCGLPVLGDKVFKPLFNKVAGVKPLAVGKTLTTEMEAKLIRSKAATILSTFGLALIGGEYVIHYTKNLITAKMFNKDSFSDVVNLSPGQMKSSQASPVVNHSQNRIKQCLAACGGILAGSFLLARGPANFKLLEKTAHGLVKHLNFEKTKKGGLCLSQRQMEMYMGLSVLAYLDSARDNLERVETGSRLLILLPYLARGQGWLQNGLLKYLPSQFKNIMNAEKGAKTLEQLAQEALNRAGQDPQKAAKLLATPLRQKAFLTGAPLTFGILGTGIGVGLLNRFWTQYRFQKHQQKDQQLGLQPKQASNQTDSRAAAAPVPLITPLSWTDSERPLASLSAGISSANNQPFQQPTQPTPALSSSAYAAPYFASNSTPPTFGAIPQTARRPGWGRIAV
jgi:hypothetical protein